MSLSSSRSSSRIKSMQKALRILDTLGVIILLGWALWNPSLLAIILFVFSLALWIIHPAKVLENWMHRKVVQR